MYLDISKNAAKELETLPQKHVSQITRKIISLQRNEFPQDCKHLSGYPGHYRVDSGEYRIVFKIVKDVINVVLINKRNDGVVYRNLQNLTS